MTTASPHITDLRTHLMATLASLRDRTNPMEPDRARAVAQVATVLVDTARVEVEYIKATGSERTSQFLTPLPAPEDKPEPASGYTQGIIERGNGITRHTLKG